MIKERFTKNFPKMEMHDLTSHIQKQCLLTSNAFEQKMTIKHQNRELFSLVKKNYCFRLLVLTKIFETSSDKRRNFVISHINKLLLIFINFKHCATFVDMIFDKNLNFKNF